MFSNLIVTPIFGVIPCPEHTEEHYSQISNGNELFFYALFCQVFSRTFCSIADSFSKPVSGSEESESGGWFRAFTVAAYKPYFDVDTSDVLERIKESLFPFKGSFTEMISNNPDL